MIIGAAVSWGDPGTAGALRHAERWEEVIGMLGADDVEEPIP